MVVARWEGAFRTTGWIAQEAEREQLKGLPAIAS
jgi:hypothetical protein